jgi:nitrite reductase/ring-hydroxylating ferredoxin subunit
MCGTHNDWYIFKKCPHSLYPLSQGVPFDIEDFGIVFSAGLTCPKHGWSFDLFNGAADRGSYELGVWETQLREVKISEESQEASEEISKGPNSVDKEVWVRRRQRVG